MGKPTGEGMSSWLRALPQTELAALLECHPDLLHRPPATLEDMAARLSQPQPVARALQLIDRTAVQVGAVLSLLDGRATVSQLVEAITRTEPVEAAEVERALEALSGVALAWPVRAGVWRAATGLRHVAEQVLAVGPSWQELLQGLSLAELRELMRCLGLGSARSSYDAVLALQHVAERPSSLRRLLDQAPPEAPALLEHLAGAGHGTPLDGSEAEAWLADRMLVVIDGDGGRGLPREVTALVRGERLVGALRRPPPDPTEPAPSPVAAAERATALVHDVRALLAACEARPVKALRSGGVGVQELRRLAKGLDKQEEYVGWLLDLAGSAGLLSTGSTAGALTREVDRWRALEESAAWLALVRPVLDSPVGPRSQLSEAAVPLATWRYPVDGGFPLPLVLDGATRHSAREDDAALVAWLDWCHYRPMPAPTRRIVLSEQLHQLMLLGLRADGACPPWAIAIRDGKDDAAVAELEAALPPAQDDAVFQADGTAFVGGRASAGLRALLDAVADREGERTWRLTPTRVREQLDAGRSADELVTELRTRSRHTLPQVVEQLVHDVAAKHGRIRVFPASTLLRIDDVPLGIEVLRDPKLKALSLAEVQPGVLFSPKPAKEVLAALRAAGHAPVGEGATSGARPARKAVTRRASSPVRSTPSADDVAARLQAAPVRTTAKAPGPRPPAAQVFSLDRYRIEQRLSHLTDLEVDLLAEAIDRGSRVEIDYVDTGGDFTTRVLAEVIDEGRLLSAWCELRDAERHFDPAGIQAVRPG